MTAPRSLSMTLPAVAVLLLGAHLANAEPRHRDHRNDPYQQDRGRDDGRRPLRDVIGEVEHNYRGRVVDVQPATPRGDSRDMYRVRVLQDGGRVKTVQVPAEREQHRD